MKAHVYTHYIYYTIAAFIRLTGSITLLWYICHNYVGCRGRLQSNIAILGVTRKKPEKRKKGKRGKILYTVCFYGLPQFRSVAS